VRGDRVPERQVSSRVAVAHQVPRELSRPPGQESPPVVPWEGVEIVKADRESPLVGTAGQGR